jgi:hypothetical protein
MIINRLVLSGGLAAAVCVVVSVARADNTGISIEAVDVYSCGQLSQNVPNIDNFRNTMLSIGGFTAGVRYTNSLVFPTDFTDPEISPGSADTFNFDRPGDAISYFSGHGTCDDQTSTSCTTTAGCPTISGLNKRCLRYTEGPITGRCAYSRPRTLVVDRTGTSCQWIDYSTGPTLWGEDPNSGSWAGGGTNGGINFAIIDNSCGITPDMYWDELGGNVFGGISSIGIIMPTRVGSDTADVASRGQAWASRYTANVNSAAAPMWADAINSVTGVSGCQFGGGNHGIVGCGANIAFSMDTTQARAEYSNRTESWVGYRNEGNDSAGRGWLSWIYTCNYDCNTHPWTL